ncbi:hypothetical protein BIZ78_gp169 [Erwinia phage vB_EamM_Caitlin]|uniref:hypothetical protein n=1 Tax=Erwinia phage vB_EamM_Caitlin TaxID=1883379 RepID=UPI00081C3590|nr:hypothetical protein BIZ78_gp169 [Erwinia phage vB_EamM_Caitlin]ANZ48406.1 hypothetical protein CAITLIN_111 [Erwinia phage vB_EamM_Caitlin]
MEKKEIKVPKITQCLNNIRDSERVRLAKAWIAQFRILVRQRANVELETLGLTDDELMRHGLDNTDMETVFTTLVASGKVNPVKEPTPVVQGVRSIVKKTI